MDAILLGFLEQAPAQQRYLTSPYFPSKVGGKPAWLNLRDLPDTKCERCRGPLSFLLQVYADLDVRETTFHRSLYVFCCKQTDCQGKSGAYKVFRCQLARQNEFFPYELKDRAAEEEEEQRKAKSKAKPKSKAQKQPDNTGVSLVPLCVVCGCKAESCCASCNAFHYCSDAHRQEHRRSGTHQCESAVEAADLTSTSGAVLPEFELVVEEDDTEPSGQQQQDEDEEEEDEEDADESQFKHELDLLRKYQEEQAQTKMTESDSKLEGELMEDLFKKMAVTDVDETFTAFNAAVAHHPEQVLRYWRSSASSPLWVASANQIAVSAVPSCPICGGRRVFEFQVMPQILYYMGESIGDLDFGTLAVFTCESSCDSAPPGFYVPEYVHFQACK
eukprot:GILK01003853.1.p1 GENE.GILK01003853.1~~GILK01003853.1.p1  ORF type:complete len:400 (-),score=68.67 GILK01003853.1:158-1321(-)